MQYQIRTRMDCAGDVYFRSELDFEGDELADEAVQFLSENYPDLGFEKVLAGGAAQLANYVTNMASQTEVELVRLAKVVAQQPDNEQARQALLEAHAANQIFSQLRKMLA